VARVWHGEIPQGACSIIRKNKLFVLLTIALRIFIEHKKIKTNQTIGLVTGKRLGQAWGWRF
jgi:hypothetical protein